MATKTKSARPAAAPAKTVSKGRGVTPAPAVKSKAAPAGNGSSKLAALAAAQSKLAALKTRVAPGAKPSATRASSVAKQPVKTPTQETRPAFKAAAAGRAALKKARPALAPKAAITTGDVARKAAPTAAAAKGKAQKGKYVYYFGDAGADGDGSMGPRGA